MGELPKSLSRRDLLRWGLGLGVSAVGAACYSRQPQPPARPQTQNEKAAATAVANPASKDAPKAAVSSPVTINNFEPGMLLPPGTTYLEGKIAAKNMVREVVVIVRPRVIEAILSDSTIGISRSAQDLAIALFIPVSLGSDNGRLEAQRLSDQELRTLIIDSRLLRGPQPGRALHGVIPVDDAFLEMAKDTGSQNPETMNQRMAEDWVRSILAQQQNLTEPTQLQLSPVQKASTRKYQPFTIARISSTDYQRRVKP